MSFQFPLAAVLRYRESLEQREHLALERLQQEIVLVEVRIHDAGENSSKAAQDRTTRLAQGARAAEVQFVYEYLRAIDQQLVALRALLQESKTRWNHQLACYQQARRNREALEKLREKQLDAYNRERAKREQAVIDDVFLSRRRRSN
jgi:flagellar protein FliJ